MQAIKNLIARRRPSGVVDPLTLDLPPEASPLADAAPDAPNADRKLAVNGNDRMPTAPRPKVAQVSDWIRKPSVAPRVDAPADPRPGPKPDEVPTPKFQIWDIEPADAPSDAPSVSVPATPPPRAAEDQPDLSMAVATPDRAKTRLLGFNMEEPEDSPFDAEAVSNSAAGALFPIGWLVVVDGPGRGASFTLTAGLSTVGRDSDQTVPLDFGDGSISRQNHISIAYDAEENRTLVGHGGKTNIVRLNDAPLLSTEDLQSGDRIKIGKTELQFVALCGAGFSWGADEAHG